MTCEVTDATVTAARSATSQGTARPATTADEPVVSPLIALPPERITTIADLPVGHGHALEPAV